MKISSVLFAAAAILWVVWGIVHVFAGIMTMVQPTGLAFAGIADAVDPALLTAVDYHAAAGAVVKQHGWNLAWIGMTTIVCVYGVWRGRANALVLAALVGGMADLGYFLFMDLGGHVNFVPGTVMTIVSSAAIIASLVGWFLERSDR